MTVPFWYPPVLAYHRVHPRPGKDTPTISPRIFEKQMAILAQRWEPTPLSEVVTRLESGCPIPRRVVVVSFDDGTEDTFTFAFPILAQYRIPATVFLIAGHIDKPGSLNSDQIRTMGQNGISFGSHTLSHSYLPSLSQAQVNDELQGSKRRLETFGFPIDLLSYPAGGFTPAIVKAVQEAGYKAACTTNRGIRRFPINRWAIRRISMHEKAASILGMWVRLSGYYGLNRRLRAPA